MPSSDEYLNRCLQRITDVGFVATRPLMGDYMIYVEDRPIGGIYEDRLFLALCESSQNALPEAQVLSPYVGAGEMLLVPEEVNSDTLSSIIRRMVDEIPVPKACRRFSLGR